MSQGRVELGLGAGWYEDEHRAYGIPFPPVAERFERLREQLEIVTGLWTTRGGERFSFTGRHYSLADSPALPKPVQTPRPPIIVGGAGAVRTPALAAQFADEFNAPFHTVDDAARQFVRVRAACEEAGRDPGSVRLSVAAVLCCGRDEAEFARRAATIGRDVADLRERDLAGTPAEVVARCGAYAAVGAGTIYLQMLDLSDLDHLRLVAEEVLPAVA